MRPALLTQFREPSPVPGATVASSGTFAPGFFFGGRRVRHIPQPLRALRERSPWPHGRLYLARPGEGGTGNQPLTLCPLSFRVHWLLPAPPQRAWEAPYPSWLISEQPGFQGARVGAWIPSMVPGPPAYSWSAAPESRSLLTRPRGWQDAGLLAPSPRGPLSPVLLVPMTGFVLSWGVQGPAPHPQTGG